MDFSQILEMLRNPQAIQARVNEIRSRTAGIRATGQSGGGMVKVTLSGDMEMISCEIAPEAVDPSDPGLLQDLVRAAHNAAAENVKEALQRELSSGMEGMQLPPGFPGGGFPGGTK